MERRSDMRHFSWLLLLSCASLPCVANGDDAALRRQAATALKKATDFFSNQVATEGGYLWRYSEDLNSREGEGKASDTTVWVQPPGTPSVGMAFLKAYRATGDERTLSAARRAGECLRRGQLQSGGWAYRIEFDPQRRRRYAYRLDRPEEGARQRNTSTLDDNTTQAALRFLMRLDAALDFQDQAIHESTLFGLAGLLEAQYPNGAWPQRFDRPPDEEKFPVKQAGYPESWPRKFPGKRYSHCYTFNDNAISDVIDVLFEASRIYDDEIYRTAAEKAGGFILSAQMPEPQPAWAQQYNVDMHPCWARRFEPPAVTGGESQGVMRTLLQLFRHTGDKKYLEPIPRALAYLRRSRLPDGRLARFYELKTNRPLYFTKEYELTYNDGDLPTHYGFVVSDRTDRIEREYRRLLKRDPAKRLPGPAGPPGKASRSLIAQVRRVIDGLDERGRWVEAGRMKYHGADAPTRRVIDCRTFIRNVGVLSAYLATQPE